MAIALHRKRKNRSARLKNAAPWLKKYKGKDSLRGYCKQFPVDWRCAAIERERLGVPIDPEYLKRKEATEQQQALARQKRKAAKAKAEQLEACPPYGSAFEAYLAGDFEALHELECRDMDESGCEFPKLFDGSEDDCPDSDPEDRIHPRPIPF